jgi:ferrous iron transport protein B
MDKIMRRFGMNGKSIVPLISGFACAVPSIMATRNISSWKERILTIMVVPLMSCSARLPVYTLLISLVIPTEKIWGFISIQGLILLGFYVLGFIAAIGASFVMSKIIKERNTSVFMLEMPSYHSPRWQNIGLTLVEKSKAFVFEAGKVIIAVSVILWALASFAPGNRMEEIEAKYVGIESNDTLNVDALIQKEQLEASYAGIIGRFIEPSIEPLGFDWKIGIALVTSFAAREVFVGTMATIYSVGNDELDVSRLTDRLKAEVNPKTGEPLYNLATAFSLMIFYAFAMQCMSTMAVTLRETKSWKWTLLQTGYMTGLAYVASWVVYNLLR